MATAAADDGANGEAADDSDTDGKRAEDEEEQGQQVQEQQASELEEFTLRMQWQWQQGDDGKAGSGGDADIGGREAGEAGERALSMGVDYRDEDQDAQAGDDGNERDHADQAGGRHSRSHSHSRPRARRPGPGERAPSWSKWRPPKRFPWSESGSCGNVSVLQAHPLAFLSLSL